MARWILAASLLLAPPGPEEEYAELTAAEAATVKRRDQESRAAHQALDAGEYERAVELARSARRRDEELLKLRAGARACLKRLIAELVPKLDDDAFEVREAASEKLRALGPAAVPGLLRLRRAQTAAEIRYRIDELLKGISVDPSGKLRQWVREATASSQYTATDWSANQMIGPPDTLQAGDARTAWAARDADGGTEWVHLKFPLEVRISRLRIHENFTPGGVVAIDVVGVDGVRRRAWEGIDPGGPAPVWFEVDLRGPVGREVIVTLDTKKRAGWEEIDAVELIGDLPEE